MVDFRRVKLLLCAVLFILMILLTLAVFGMANASDESNVLQYMEQDKVDTTYSKYYPCTFLQCLVSEENNDILFSGTGHDFFERTKYFLFVGLASALGLFVVFSRKLKTALRNLGIPFVVIGLSAITPLVFPAWQWSYLNVQAYVKLFFEPLLIPLIILFILGIGLLIWSYILHKDETSEGY